MLYFKRNISLPVEAVTNLVLIRRPKHVSYFPQLRIRGKYSLAGRSSPSALDALMCSARRLSQADSLQIKFDAGFCLPGSENGCRVSPALRVQFRLLGHFVAHARAR